ncbi:MAG: HAD family hydrolase [Candidatus Zixiibacteriota bacterium]|nr:MAG: HAD family hydrolase [candidate division Zixibacteria bacterium]
MSHITSILFDIGWPIIDETDAHRAWNRHLKRRIREISRKDVTDPEIKCHEEDAVRCYAPSMFSYVIWQLVRPEKELFYALRAEFDGFDFHRYHRIQPGVIDVLARLHGKFKLGFAANQPEAVYKFLEEKQILQYFGSREVSAEIGFAKPDVRMFLKVLENLGARPHEAIMVGDRQDNDIVPARIIGMKTVLLRIGPHKDQPVRYPKEEPDFTIDTILNLLDIPLISNKL